jgi:hypothetical protein
MAPEDVLDDISLFYHAQPNKKLFARKFCGSKI